MLKFMEKMMGFMMDRTSKEEKQEMMAEMMDRFFADMTAEDKQHLMEAMMPKMMEGVNMMEMMPHCLTMMLPHGPKDKRMDFTLNMIATLVQQSCADMSGEDKQQFVSQVMEKVHAAESAGRCPGIATGGPGWWRRGNRPYQPIGSASGSSSKNCP